jgi:HEAT repeat
MNNFLEEFINEHRTEFDDRKPDDAVLEKIQHRMQVGMKQKAKIVFFTPFRLVAAASIIAIIVAATLWIKTPLFPNSSNTVTTKQPELIPPSIKTENQVLPKSNEPLAALATIKLAINKDKQQLFHLLSNNLSASERLAGATKAYSLKNPDKDIIDVLVKTMDKDPNSNVRLAALEALGKFYQEPYVKNKLVKSLEKQKDPVVQIALIELLTNMKEASIIKELQKISTDANSIRAVKDQAYSGLQKLSL